METGPYVGDEDRKLEEDAAQGRLVGLFSVPFFKGRLDLDHEQVAQDCKDSCERSTTEGDARYTNYFDETARAELYKAQWWSSFRKQVFDTYRKYQRLVNGVEVTEDDYIHFFAWASWYRLDDCHSSHVHHMNYVSGTYYPLAGEIAAPIRFVSPHDMASIVFIPGDCGEVVHEDFYLRGLRHNHLDATCYPSTGDILLWPSYVPHDVDSGRKIQAPEDYERIAISFNLAHYPMGGVNEDERYGA